jgi:hypothetical protein
MNATRVFTKYMYTFTFQLQSVQNLSLFTFQLPGETDCSENSNRSYLGPNMKKMKERHQ